MPTAARSLRRSLSLQTCYSALPVSRKAHPRILVKHSITYTGLAARVGARLALALEDHLFFAVAALPVALRLAVLLVKIVILALDALFDVWRIFGAVRVRVRSFVILMR